MKESVKRLISFVLAVFMLACLAACSTVSLKSDDETMQETQTSYVQNDDEEQDRYVVSESYQEDWYKVTKVEFDKTFKGKMPKVTKKPKFYNDDNCYALGGNTGILPDISSEQLVDYISSKPYNPILLTKLWFDKHAEITIDHDLFPNFWWKDTSEIGIKEYDGQREKFDFSQEGSEKFLKCVFNCVSEGYIEGYYKLGSEEYNLEAASDFDLVLKDLPEFKYSKEDDCYYTYIVLKRVGSAYVITFYMKSSDGKYITSVSSESAMIYYYGGYAAGASLSHESLHKEMFSHQILLQAAVESVLSGHSVLFDNFKVGSRDTRFQTIPKNYSGNGIKTKSEYFARGTDFDKDDPEACGHWTYILEYTVTKVS